jgi:imidazolonepropionase-like amidohydrolase
MKTLYRSTAIADARGPDLALDQSILVADDVIAWMGHDDEAPEPDAATEVVDGGGATVVPGMVDAHSHSVLPGGSHWIARIDDETDALLDIAEHNGALALQSGVRWFRDVGSPRRDERALALTVRDSWAGRRDRPYIRAAGTWLAQSGVLPPGVAVEVPDADGLVAAVEAQIADGADLVKLYLDGPDHQTSPWTADEVLRATEHAHDQNVPVTAHATILDGARSGVHGGVDCIEHGSRLDAELASEMAIRGTYVVPTLALLDSFESFATTTSIDRFTSAERRGVLAERREDAYHSVGLARAAGVTIAAGTDFGGGSLRANNMAWEVQCLVSAGLDPWEALASATWIGGDLLGEPSAGTISVGGPADFFLVHGNPLEDPQALWRVWRVA